MTDTVYAYRNFRGRRRDGVIVSGIIPQFDGSAYAGMNCGAASEAMRVVSQRKGARPSKGSPWQPTGASIRRETGDTSGGLNPYQTTRASETEYGVPHASPRIDDWSIVLNKLWAGYAVDLLISYGPLDGTNASGSPGFRGNHRVVLVGITRNSSGVVRVLSADPLYDGRRTGIPLGPRWIMASTMRSAAGKLDLGGGTTVNAKYGAGHAYFIPSLTRTNPNTYKATVPAGKFFAYNIRDGRIVGRTAKNTDGFSAKCTASQAYLWPGKGTYHLVQLLDGGRKGMYIGAKYSSEG
jgi:hypothetical protein